MTTRAAPRLPVIAAPRFRWAALRFWAGILAACAVAGLFYGAFTAEGRPPSAPSMAPAAAGP